MNHFKHYLMTTSSHPILGQQIILNLVRRADYVHDERLRVKARRLLTEKLAKTGA